MTDGDLVRQILAGNSSAYGELAGRWSARVLAYCHAKTGNFHVAEDLAQETLLRGLKALASLAEPDKFAGWLFGVAQRVCLDWRKSKQSSQVNFAALDDGRAIEPLLASDPREAERLADEREDLDRLMKIVEKLPEETRETLMLYYYQDFTYRELAEVLGVSAATVNARLTKARAWLRERCKVVESRS